MVQTRTITEGFDLYPAANTPGYGLLSSWTLLGGTPPQFVAGRFGGQAMLMPNGLTTYNIARFFPATNLNAGGVALFLAKPFTSARAMIILRSGSNNRFNLRAEIGGNLSVLANNTVLATTSSPVLTVASWHYLEFEVEHNAVTGKVRVYLNDFELPELRLDNVNMAGATNFANVDDIPAQDATYNFSATVGDEDLFGIAPMPSNPTKIFGVQLTTLAMKDEASTRAIRGLLKSGAAPVQETADIPLALNSPQFSRTFYPLDPDTGAPFLRPGVEALNIGYKVSV